MSEILITGFSGSIGSILGKNLPHDVRQFDLPDNYQIIWGVSRKEPNELRDLRSPLWTPQTTYTASLLGNA